MNQLKIIITHEYLSDIRSKSFWISTIVFPLVMIAFGGIIGFLSSDSDTLQTAANPLAPDDDLSGMQIFGMMIGMFLTLFIMIYGAQIFNKVKVEKTNRIAEIISACVPGRTMLCAKVIAVGMVGITQLLLWGLLIGIFISGIMIVFPVDIPFGELISLKVLMGTIWGILYFAGGYVFFGSMFAAVGAMTDQNNENQEYMTLLTFILLGSFYVGEYAVDHLGGSLTVWCSFIPFTSPTVGAVSAIGGTTPIWQTLLSLAVLYASAWFSLSIAGKIYTSALMLRGKKLGPKDLINFLRMK